jgi:hypothetical protein
MTNGIITTTKIIKFIVRCFDPTDDSTGVEDLLNMLNILSKINNLNEFPIESLLLQFKAYGTMKYNLLGNKTLEISNKYIIDFANIDDYIKFIFNM